MSCFSAKFGAPRLAASILITLAAFMPAAQAQQATVTFDLDDVLLLPDDTNPGAAAQQMTGRFVWTYNVGDFENGTGDFTDLLIPFGGSSLGPLDITVETKSMEFVLADDFHDLGVDVSLKLTTAFTEDLGAPVDLVLSKWQIEIGIITSGHIISGSIIPTCWSPVNYGSGNAGSGGFVPTITSSGGEPRIGNDSFQIDCDQVLGGSTGILLLGFGQTQLPAFGIQILVNPTNWILDSSVATGTSGVAGADSLMFPVPIPNDTLLIGMEIDFQAVAFDSGAPQGFLSASDGLTLNLCVQ